MLLSRLYAPSARIKARVRLSAVGCTQHVIVHSEAPALARRFSHLSIHPSSFKLSNFNPRVYGLQYTQNPHSYNNHSCLHSLPPYARLMPCDPGLIPGQLIATKFACRFVVVRRLDCIISHLALRLGLAPSLPFSTSSSGGAIFSRFLRLRTHSVRRQYSAHIA